MEKKDVKPKVAKSGKAAKQPPTPEPIKEEPQRERRNSGEAPKEQRKGNVRPMILSLFVRVL